jgi:membrane protein implicated in regulation of membrane protease activity
MTWADFYLICFFLGFALSALSLFGSFHIDLPHFDFHVGGDHAHGHHAGVGDSTHAPRINFGTISAFLAWFGGTGYLLARFSGFWSVLALGLAFVSGLIGATIVFYFLAKILIRKDEDLNPADYDMIGVLGTVTSYIRPGGTGEIIFSQAGTRRSASARSEANDAIEKGIEVIVTRYERGIAYVRPWNELADSPKSD